MLPDQAANDASNGSVRHQQGACMPRNTLPMTRNQPHPAMHLLQLVSKLH
jgi:hypothetical protein